MTSAPQTAPAQASTGYSTVFGALRPAVINYGDHHAVELGLRFTVRTPGKIKGVRFYKAAANTGTHTGSLWTANGTLLARAKFADETSSGWQTVRFAKPVAIDPGVTYVAGYYAPYGHYSVTSGGLRSSVSNGPLRAAAGAGVYMYGGDSFPTMTYHDDNYYVDVVFVSGSRASADPPGGSTGSTISSGPSGASAGSRTTCLQRQGDGSIDPVYADLDACGFPSPDTAGVPAGADLDTVSTSCNCLPAHTAWNDGMLWISGATTINGLYIPGGVVLQTSAGVTIENSQIMVGGYADGNIINGQGFGNLTVAHSTVSGTENASMTDCADPADSDIGDVGPNITLSYDFIACAGEPINGGTYTVSHSYVIVDGYPSGAHVEDWYIPGGGSATAEDNTLIQPYDQTAGIFGDSKLGPLRNVLVENNLIGGNQNNGGLALGCIGNEGAGESHSIVVENNRFSSAYDTGAWPFVAGNTDGGSDNTWTGNVMDGSEVSVRMPATSC